MKSKFLLMILFSFLLTGLASSADAQKVDFETQIKPLLEKHCMECHNADGDSYPIEVKDDAFAHIVEGEPEESDMYLVMVTDDEDELMPPADFGRPMTESEIELVKTWIAEGAEWPDDAEFVMWKPDEDDGDTKDEVASADAVEKKDLDDAEKDAKEVEPDVDPRIYKAVGSLHPAILHLPMGLLLAAGLFALLSLRGNFVMSDCAYYCLWLGVLGSILACVTGWYNSEMSKQTVFEFADIFQMDHRVSWHRASALISTIFGLLVALFAMSARAKDPDEGATWKLGAIILAAGIGYVGMTGGKLVYGSNHYKDLNSLWTEAVGDIGGEAEPAAVDDGDADDSDAEPAAGDDGDADEDDGDDDSDEAVTTGQLSNTI